MSWRSSRPFSSSGGGMSVVWYVMTRQGRPREGERELRGRVAYLEGRLLPFDEARRQRGG